MKLEVQIRTRGATIVSWREAYFSEPFCRLVEEETNLRERKVIERATLPDGHERCLVRVVPNVRLPAPVRKLVGEDEISYTEITTYDPAQGSASLEIDNPAGENVRVTGEVRYLQDDGFVEMRFSGDVKVKVFAIGGLIERFIASEVRKRYADMGALLQRYLDEQAG